MEQKRTPSLPWASTSSSATLRSLAGVQEEGEMEKRFFRRLAGASKDFKETALPEKVPLRPGSFTSVEGKKCQPRGPSQNISREQGVSARSPELAASPL